MTRHFLQISSPRSSAQTGPLRISVAGSAALTDLYVSFAPFLPSLLTFDTPLEPVRHSGGRRVCFQGLAQLEILCKQLYETTDTAVRHQAEKALVEFTNSPDCLSKCQLLLERGSVSHLCRFWCDGADERRVPVAFPVTLSFCPFSPAVVVFSAARSHLFIQTGVSNQQPSSPRATHRHP